jgi:phosphopantothenoylcysteine decarboxylase / phosphopantothenate---cysteine ligase
MKNILISNGATRSYIDPIRYITNISSGKMGLAFINAFLKKNKSIKVVSGKVDFEYPKDKNLEIFETETNHEMLEELKKHFKWADVFISIAAVMDFDVLNFSTNKIKKNDSNEIINIKFKNSIDIVKSLSEYKKENQILIGFALETEKLIENAIQKMKDKKLDFIIANEAKESMGLDTAKVCLIDKNKNLTYFESQNKSILAEKIIEKIFNI